MVTEYRVFRKDNPGGQGHYIVAKSKKEALAKFAGNTGYYRKPNIGDYDAIMWKRGKGYNTRRTPMAREWSEDGYESWRSKRIAKGRKITWESEVIRPLEKLGILKKRRR